MLQLPRLQKCSNDWANVLMDDKPLFRLGVIGLGKLWETRHRPALERLKSHFRVVAVYDQVSERARRTADQIRCRQAENLESLIQPDLIDAIYVLSPQWFEIYPAKLAIGRGLPVYCGVPVVSIAQARDLQDLIISTGVRFMPEFARRYYPATQRLHELLRTRLGPVRMIMGHTRMASFDRYGLPGPNSQNTPVSLRVDPMYFLLDWVRHIIGKNPMRLVETDTSTSLVTNPRPVVKEAEFCSITLQFEGGAVAQMTCHRHDQARWGDITRVPSGPGFQVFAEKGMAFLEMPDLIRWYDNSGYHEERLVMSPSIGETLNLEFYRWISGEPYQGPAINDVVAINELYQASSDR